MKHGIAHNNTILSSYEELMTIPEDKLLAEFETILDNEFKNGLSQMPQPWFRREVSVKERAATILAGLFCIKNKDYTLISTAKPNGKVEVFEDAYPEGENND